MIQPFTRLKVADNSGAKNLSISVFLAVQVVKQLISVI